MSDEVHPVANLFPMMSDDELQELAADIKANGLREPISLYENRIIDGRNRLAACKIAGVEPVFDIAPVNGSPTCWVISKNLHRRHLTAQQRATVAVDMLPLLREEAHQRKKQGQQNGGESRKLPGAHSGLLKHKKRQRNHKAEARDIAGRAVGVAGRTVSQAAAIKAADPEEFERMRRGEVSISSAYRRAVEQRTAPPSRNAAAEKRRMIDVLSRIRGSSRGLLEQAKVPLLLQALSPKEIKTWTDLAASAARDLRTFAASLRSNHHEEQKQLEAD